MYAVDEEILTQIALEKFNNVLKSMDGFSEYLQNIHTKPPCPREGELRYSVIMFEEVDGKNKRVEFYRVCG